MSERDITALDSYQLIPKLLHDVHHVDMHMTLLDKDVSSPILPLIDTLSGTLSADTLHLVDAEVLLAQDDKKDAPHSIALLKSEKMGELMPKVRKLTAAGVAALAIDLTRLADTAPYGTNEWKPKTREDLAELGAAAGSPLWLYGICSPADAEIAVEAGVNGIVVHAGASYYLGGPGTAEIFPDVFDTVAGMTSIYAGGPIRNGIDVFRYLAIGAEAVIVDSDRALSNLQAELEYAMRLTGCETLADISYEAIFAPLFQEV